MGIKLSRTGDVPTQIKNSDLVKRRRKQIVDAAVQLFIEKGFHKTTTRQIAGAAGLSTGSMYEYVNSKEDILYLVCDAIHEEVEEAVSGVLASAGGRDALSRVIREYFHVCNNMSDHILLIYQETQSLPVQWRNRVLENEVRITGMFVRVLENLVSSGDLAPLDERLMELVAHNITVLGHMWTFRRWFLSRQYSIDDYVTIQTKIILGTCDGQNSA